MRKIFKILIVLPLLYLIITPAWFASSANIRHCTGIRINIRDSSDYHFVTEQHLFNIVNESSGKILGQPVKKIHVGTIEKKISELRELRSAEVYFSIDGILHVTADQRTPVMRIIPDEGGDFFMCKEGYLFRKRNLYTPRLHIVRGNIDITPAMLDNVSILDSSIKNTILKDIFLFVSYLNTNSFWSAQIDQIYIDSRKKADLIPLFGDHLIHLGSFENFEGKLKNLRAFYDKVLPETGWDKYTVINLEFRDQIVCRK